MNWEEVSAVSTFITMIIIAASAVAAVLQLRHMRAGNAITGFLGMMDRWASPKARETQNYVFGGELDRKMSDPGYRNELQRGLIDRIAHPEVDYLDFWESLGGFVKLGYFPEDLVMESGGPIAMLAWEKLKPVIAIIRNVRGPAVYDNFEFLVSRAQLWEQRHPDGVFPRGTPHLAVAEHRKDAGL